MAPRSRVAGRGATCQEIVMRHVLRDLVSYSAVLLVVAALAGFTWLTNNPQAPVLEAAQEWPLVGGLAQAMRRAYLGESSPPVAARPEDGEDLADAGEAAVSGPIRLPIAVAPRRSGDPPAVTAPRRVVSEPEEPAPRLPVLVVSESAPNLGRIVFDEPEPVQARHVAIGWRWFLPGQPLRAARGEAVGGRVLPSLAYLPILGSEGGWSQVLYQGRPGWVDDAWRPPHQRRGARQGGIRRHVEPPRVSSFDRVHQARKLLGQRRTDRSLGAYKLWTDVEDEELLAFLDGLAAVAEDAYFARFARLPSGDPLRTAVLFAREEDYRRYGAGSGLGEGHSGHAGGGVLASYTAGRPRGEVAGTLVHEIAHLLNARALSWDLPPWLEEGMASELGAVWVEDTAVAGADGFGGAPAASFRGYDDHDQRLVHLGERLRGGGLPALVGVLMLDRDGFYAADSTLHYSYSGALVRYLLDGDGGRYRDGFGHFLQRVANGYVANPALFLDSFGTRDAAFLAALDRDFRGWIGSEQAAARARLQRSARNQAAR
jgi:hypothetical protein